MTVVITWSPNMTAELPTAELPGEDKIEEFIEESLGPRWAPPHVFLTTVILYSLILIVGLSANLFVIVASVLNAKKLSISDWYLLSLALSDLVLLLLGLPFELRDASTEWYPYPYPEFICRGRAFLTEMTGSISALTIAAFSIQRYFAICHPLKVQSVSNPIGRTLGIIGTVWTAGFSMAFPCLFVIKINVLWLAIQNVTDQPVNTTAYIGINTDARIELDSDAVRIALHGSEYCYFDESRPYMSMMYVHFSFWLSFMLPLLLIIALYARIVANIRSAFAMHAANTRGHRELNKRRAAVNMSVAVASSFFICWLPFHLQRLLAVHIGSDGGNEQVQNFQSLLFFVSGYFYYGNSVANPILYTLLTERMRRTLFKMLWCKEKVEPGTSPSAVSLSMFSRQHSRTSLSAVIRKTSPMNPARPMLVRYSPQLIANYGTERYLTTRVSPCSLALMLPSGDTQPLDNDAHERTRAATLPNQ